MMSARGEIGRKRREKCVREACQTTEIHQKMKEKGVAPILKKQFYEKHLNTQPDVSFMSKYATPSNMCSHHFPVLDFTFCTNDDLGCNIQSVEWEIEHVGIFSKHYLFY